MALNSIKDPLVLFWNGTQIAECIVLIGYMTLAQGEDMKNFIIATILAMGSMSFGAVDCPFVQADGACSAADRSEGRCLSVESILGTDRDVTEEGSPDSVI